MNSSNNEINESNEMIKAITDNVIYNEGNEIKTLDGSIQADIVINSDDKEYVNEQTEQTKKMMNEERELKREMYFRHSRVLYPDKEEWILSLAIDAFMEQEEKGIDITKNSFENLSVSKSSL
jgi:hypothetical protein